MELYLVPGSKVGFACALCPWGVFRSIYRCNIPCGPRILAEFGMVAFAWRSATSFGVFHIFSALGWMQEFTFLTYHAVSSFFFVKITNCVDFSKPFPTFFVLSLLSCCYCCFPACLFYLMSSMFALSSYFDLSPFAHSFGVPTVFNVWDSILLSSVGTSGRVGFLCCNNILLHFNLHIFHLG